MFKSLLNNVAGLQSCNFIWKRLQHRYFPVKYAKFLTPILKNICEQLLLQFLSHSSMFIICITDLSTKNKMQRRGFTILQKSKIKTVGNRKTIFFSVNLFQKILIFQICVSSENAQWFVGLSGCYGQNWDNILSQIGYPNRG